MFSINILICFYDDDNDKQIILKGFFILYIFFAIYIKIETCFLTTNYIDDTLHLILILNLQNRKKSKIFSKKTKK